MKFRICSRQRNSCKLIRIYCEESNRDGLCMKHQIQNPSMNIQICESSLKIRFHWFDIQIHLNDREYIARNPSETSVECNSFIATCMFMSTNDNKFRNTRQISAWNTNLHSGCRKTITDEIMNEISHQKTNWLWASQFVSECVIEVYPIAPPNVFSNYRLHVHHDA